MSKTLSSDTADYLPKPSRVAWIAVGVLCALSALNYLDRVLITSMRDSVRANIAMTDAQFGLLTSIFLWVYAAFNPLGGYIADKFGCRRVILLSLVAWSIATWYTGQAHSFSQLLLARGFMGISEACYFPAGLALISNHHRGATRSLATGIYYIGINVGAALGGGGGYLADHFGWRFGFSLLGGVGIAYAVVAVLLLKDAEAPAESSEASAAPMEMLTVAKALLTSGPFWLFLVIFTLAGNSNWMLIGWMPTYFRQQFHLSQSAAGISATIYVYAGQCLGVIVGGRWADRWSLRDPRARIKVGAIGLGLAAPALFLTGTCHALSIGIISVSCFGFAAGFFAANIMPILRQTAEEKYSATGYGVMNMVSCIVGGLSTYGAGALLDAKVSLGGMYQATAIGVGLGAVPLLYLKIRGSSRSGAAIAPEGGPRVTVLS